MLRWAMSEPIELGSMVSPVNRPLIRQKFSCETQLISAINLLLDHNNLITLPVLTASSHQPSLPLPVSSHL